MGSPFSRQDRPVLVSGAAIRGERSGSTWVRVLAVESPLQGASGIALVRVTMRGQPRPSAQGALCVPPVGDPRPRCPGALGCCMYSRFCCEEEGAGLQTPTPIHPLSVPLPPEGGQIFAPWVDTWRAGVSVCLRCGGVQGRVWRAELGEGLTLPKKPTPFCQAPRDFQAPGTLVGTALPGATSSLSRLSSQRCAVGLLPGPL